MSEPGYIEDTTALGDCRSASAKRKGVDLSRNSASQHSTMWWSGGVADAIKNCQLRKSILVILVEPSEDGLKKRASGSETNQQMLSRVSTASMHRITFAHPAVTSTIHDSQAVCLKFPSDESNADFRAFTVYFKLHGIPPNLYFISPLTGQTLVHKSGFVSPKIFLDSLATTTKNVSGRVLNVTKLESHMSTSGASPAARAWAGERLEERDERDVVDGVQHQAMVMPEGKHDTMATTPDTGSRGMASQSKPALSSQPAVSGSKSMKLPGGSKNEYGEDARLLARVPGGRQARKIFPGTTPFSVVRSWLAEEAKSPANALVISTAFPRRVFDLGENPKMLSELDLVPSETLIVAVSGNATDSAPREQSANAQPASGLKAYAAGALGMMGGFFRSFVADNPNVAPPSQEQPQSSQFSSTTPRGTTRAQAPPAIRIDRPRPNRSRPDDDENLLSNGNSTQYGWNPRDEEEDRT